MSAGQFASRPTALAPTPWPAHVQPSEARALLGLATPIALVALVNMAMSVTDAVMAAGFGAEGLATVAVGSDFYSIVFYFAAGVIGGLGPFYASATAAGSAARRRSLRRTGWLLLCLTAAASVPAVWFAPSFLLLLGLDADLLARGAGYTRAMAATLVPMLVVMLFRTRLTAEQRPGVILRVTLAAVPLNAVLDYALMYGIGGWAGFGLTGAGLASFLVASAMAAALAFVGGAPPERDAVAPIDWHELRNVVRTGLQIGVATVAEVGIFLGATLFAATLSAPEVAAHAVAIRAAGLAYALPSGLLQAAMVQTARAEEHIAARRTTIMTSLALAGAAGLLLFAVLALAAGPLASHLFHSAQEGRAAAELAVALLVLVGVMQLYDPAASVAAGLLRGRKDTRAPMVYALVGYWAVAAPLGLVLGQEARLGIVGVWLALALGTALAAALSLARLRRHWPV